MTKRQLRKQLKEFSHKTEATTTLYSGALGIYIGGHQYVDVPNRPGFVYVRLRNNTSELIQAHNEVVSPVYGLPVILVRNKTYYEIYGRDSVQYASYWDSSSSYLPKHGHQHEFDPDNNGGGDLVFVHGEQFYPMMTFPSGTDGGNTVLIAPYRYYYSSAWHYAGDTGAGNLLQYGPTGASNAKLLLVGIDASTGNPFVKLGSEFDASITGAAAMTSYVPTNITQSTEIPGAIVRLVTGTSTITWANIYDARQYMGILQAAGGATDFLGLSDTPNSYSGQADKLVVVNSAANALEFRTATGTSGGGSPYTDTLQVQITGSVNNLNPAGLSTAQTLVLMPDGSYTITGIAGGVNGRILHILNNGNGYPFEITFDDENGLSSANNRFYFSIDKIIIGAQEGIDLIYDGVTNNKWTILGEHRQRGQWNLSGRMSATVTGTTNDFNQATTADTVVLMLSGTVQSDITGITPIDPVNNSQGKIMFIQNIGTTLITIKKESGLSTSNNRFSIPADIPIPPLGAASFRYDADATRWRPIDAISTGSSGGGATTFIALTDVPNSYSGQGSKFVAVKSDASGLEFVTAPAGGGGGGSGLVVYDDSVYKVTGTAISFDAGLNVVTSGTIAYVSTPQCGTYQRVGQAIALSGITGLFWKVPDGIYASGSLAVFNNGLLKYIGLDYTEQLWVSGTYQYLTTPITGTVHWVMYGVPCATQIQPSTGTTPPVSNFAIQDSDSILLLDSDNIQILDSDG